LRLRLLHHLEPQPFFLADVAAGSLLPVLTKGLRALLMKRRRQSGLRIYCV
jgi:hypothetical protein